MEKFELTLYRNEPRADSRLMADRMGLKHTSTFALIKKHKTAFERHGQVIFEIGVSKRKNGGGNPQKFALLNEDQAFFLLTLSRNNEVVVDLKSDMVEAFSYYRRREHRRAMRRTEIDWVQSRYEVKDADKKAMSMVGEFVGVAEVLGQSPEKARMNFANTHKMIYKELFGLKISEKNPLPANFRDNISGDHLDYLKMALRIANDAFAEALMCCSDYHAPYYVAGERVRRLVSLVNGPFNPELDATVMRPRQLELLS